MINDNEKRINEKVDFFFEQKINVHVELKDKTFLNGLILKKLRDNIYWLQERKLGQVFLFLKDIYEISEFREEIK